MKKTWTIDEAIELAEKEEGLWMDSLLSFFPNYWGISLYSVESITIDQQEDGQMKDLYVKLIPNNSEEYRRQVELNCGKR